MPLLLPCLCCVQLRPFRSPSVLLGLMACSQATRSKRERKGCTGTFLVHRHSWDTWPPALSQRCCMRAQIRSLVAGGVIGALLSIIIHKLSLTTGIIPSFNIAAGLLGFIVLRSWTGLLKRFGLTPHPFTPQVCSLLLHPAFLRGSQYSVADIPFPEDGVSRSGLHAAQLAVHHGSVQCIHEELGHRMLVSCSPGLSKLMMLCMPGICGACRAYVMHAGL